MKSELNVTDVKSNWLIKNKMRHGRITYTMKLSLELHLGAECYDGDDIIITTTKPTM